MATQTTTPMAFAGDIPIKAALLAIAEFKKNGVEAWIDGKRSVRVTVRDCPLVLWNRVLTTILESQP